MPFIPINLHSGNTNTKVRTWTSTTGNKFSLIRRWASSTRQIHSHVSALISLEGGVIHHVLQFCATFTLSHGTKALIIDFRVNFLKYQKPEKDLSFLKNSETYRTIHHMTPVENGIEKRPEVVAAEQDILKVKRLIHLRMPVYKL